MSENTRKISINLDSLKIPSGNKTRKNRDPSTEKKIKVRTPPKAQNKSLKKNLLKFIRNLQDKKMKAENAPISDAPLELDFKSDFSESLEYLSDVAKKNDIPKISYNKTLRSLPSTTNPMPMLPSPPIFALPDVSNAPFFLPQPKYGCLKGGKLPLYKQYTRKQYDNDPQPFKTTPIFKPTSPTAIQPFPTAIQPFPTSTQPFPTATQPFPKAIQPFPTATQPFPKAIQPLPITQLAPAPPSLMPSQNINLGKLNMFKEMSNKLSISDLYKPPVPKKRRKTLRRTYKIGKSKTAPKVSVLISNRTIRNQISNKSQLLKQTPMQDIKKHLIKNGFIKVGSIAPNDVLRKMYETSMLACGEIHNYNPENLVYNFFNIEPNPN